MTVLTALAAAYDRLAEEGRAPPYGYSTETIDYVISLKPDGSVAQVAPLGDGKSGRALPVPQAVKRSSGIAANFLWDKTSYVLGITALQTRKKVERRHPFLDESAPLGLVPHLQALLLARMLRGDLDAYPPWLWN